ncbi:MAG: aminotransferase class I/II-fold pyridoxal phosphate-dependent enzyme [Eubacteriales bacterium]
MGDCDKKLSRLVKQRTIRDLFEMIYSTEDIAAEYLLDSDEIKKITYKEYRGMIGSATKKILNEIDGKGEFVGLKLKNSPVWPVVFWSILAAGNNVVLIDYRSDDTATMHILKQAGAKAIITDAEAKLPGIKIIDPEKVAKLSQYDYNYSFSDKFGDRVAICTSGTTATSKVNVYEEKTIIKQLSATKDILSKKNDLLSDDDMRNLAFLPFHHIFGFIAVFLWSSIFSKCVIYIKDMTPETIMHTCRKLKVTHIFAVPLFWNNVAFSLLKKARLGGQETVDKLEKYLSRSLALQKRLGKYGRAVATKLFFREIQSKLFGSDVRFMISGGGHILPETLRIVNGLGYHLVNGYGMTETGINSVELSEDIGTMLAGSVGDPLSPTQYSLKNVSGVNELLVKGESIHSGRMIDGKYEKRDITEECFATGDMASLVHGKYFIDGRIKEVIVNESGENVYPDEVEDAFISISGVESYCVTGTAKEGPYEDIALVIYMGESPSGDDIKRAIDEIYSANAYLPIYKKLTRVVISNEALPLASGIKVKRQALRNMLEDGKLKCVEVDLKNKAIKTDMVNKHEDLLEQIKDPMFVEIKETIRSIFADVLSLEVANVSDNAHFIDDLGGDSLSSLSVMTKAEEMYNIPINESDYLTCTCVYDLSKLLYNRIKGIEEEEVKGQKQEVEAITKFEDSKEYKAYLLRRKEIEDSGMADPFFIQHESVIKDTSIVNGKEVINFGAYNYLGFSGHPETVAAAKAAIDKYGTSASGSRLIGGEKSLHRKLEKKIAEWKHTEDAIVCVGGHSTNVTFVGNFCSENDIILYDALSHNSITQGCQLSKSDTKAFPHNDLSALENLLKMSRPKYEKILIIVEGVYSMDGDIAPIPEFVRLKKKYGAFLMVDEAHSSCVIGETGRGVDEYFNLAPDDIDIKMGTLSKGLGTCGGYLAGKSSLISYLKYSMPGFVFSVGLSPALAAASLKAIEIMIKDNSRVKSLHKNIKTFVREAKRHNFNICLAGESAIIPVLVGSDLDAYILSEKMLSKGIFVPAAVYPAVPKNQSRLRFNLAADHKEDQIVFALNMLDKLFEEYNIKKI